MTSRQAYFRHRGDLSLVGADALLQHLETIELSAFDEGTRGTFLRAQGLDKDQIRQVETYVKNLGAEELLASPLMLKILGNEVKQGGTLQGSSATEAFDVCVRRVCEREVPKGRTRWEPD